MTAPGTDPGIGSLADEAGQLIDAVTARLARFRTEAAKTDAVQADEVRPAAVDPAPTAPSDGSVHTCVGWCPICRGADLLRGDRSEISEKLVDTALLVLSTLRSLIPAPGSATAADGSHTTDRADPPGVERIDIR